MFFIFLKHILFTIGSINLFFMYNFILQNSKFKHLSNSIAIDFWFYWNFTSMEDIKRKCNPIVDLSKFTSNKKYILSGFMGLIYNQVCCQTLSKI